MANDRKEGEGKDGAIAKVAEEAITRLGPASAGIIGMVAGVPVLGVVTSAAVAVLLFGRSFLPLLHSTRVRNAVQRVIEEDDWDAVYREQLKHKGRERLKRELLRTLRNLEEAIAPEAVEPLTRLFRAHARSEVDWYDVRGLGAVFCRLTGQDLAALRGTLQRAVQVCSDRESFDLYEREVDGQWVVHVAAGAGGPTAIPGPEGSPYAALGALASENLVLRTQPSNIGPEAMTQGSHRFGFSREQATFILSLFE